MTVPAALSNETHDQDQDKTPRATIRSRDALCVACAIAYRTAALALGPSSAWIASPGPTRHPTTHLLVLVESQRECDISPPSRMSPRDRDRETLHPPLHRGGYFRYCTVLYVTALVALLEIRVMTDVTGDAEFRGDFRNGFDFGWDEQTEEWKLQKRAVELNQGRAAMMGILGLMVHEQLGGSLPIVGAM